MTILVTCGPAWEAVDGMRRLTNASTGRLGTVLAEAFRDDGHRVLVFRGDMATARPPRDLARCVGFSTNDDLAGRLDEVSRTEEVQAVFHAAALCDYRVAAIRDAADRVRSDGKIPTDSGRIVLELEPAPKVLPRLRAWFPGAWLCGWKCELDGTPDQVLSKARRQIESARSDACVVNGRAWGPGFGLFEPGLEVAPFPDAPGLAAGLVRRLRELG